MRHLYARGVAGDDIQKIIAAYESVRDAMPRHTLHDQLFTLNQTQRDKLTPSYDTAYYIPACPLSTKSSLGKGVDRKQIESAYFGSNPNLAVIDNLLNQEVLSRLRAFCREATIWKDVKAGYLGTYLLDGFCEPLLLQIAHELCQALPAILGDHPLIEMWAYKCDQEQSGGSLTIPHRANRALVFNSNLVHKTDDCHFRAGYSNRRTNITMLFGHRFNR